MVIKHMIKAKSIEKLSTNMKFIKLFETGCTCTVSLGQHLENNIRIALKMF